MVMDNAGETSSSQALPSKASRRTGGPPSPCHRQGALPRPVAVHGRGFVTPTTSGSTCPFFAGTDGSRPDRGTYEACGTLGTTPSWPQPLLRGARGPLLTHEPPFFLCTPHALHMFWTTASIVAAASLLHNHLQDPDPRTRDTQRFHLAANEDNLPCQGDCLVNLNDPL